MHPAGRHVSHVKRTKGSNSAGAGMNEQIYRGKVGTRRREVYGLLLGSEQIYFEFPSSYQDFVRSKSSERNQARSRHKITRNYTMTTTRWTTSTPIVTTSGDKIAVPSAPSAVGQVSTRISHCGFYTTAYLDPLKIVLPSGHLGVLGRISVILGRQV